MSSVQVRWIWWPDSTHQVCLERAVSDTNNSSVTTRWCLLPINRGFYCKFEALPLCFFILFINNEQKKYTVSTSTKKPKIKLFLSEYMLFFCTELLFTCVWVHRQDRCLWPVVSEWKPAIQKVVCVLVCLELTCVLSSGGECSCGLHTAGQNGSYYPHCDCHTSVWMCGTVGCLWPRNCPQHQRQRGPTSHSEVWSSP